MDKRVHCGTHWDMLQLPHQHLFSFEGEVAGWRAGTNGRENEWSGVRDMRFTKNKKVKEENPNSEILSAPTFQTRGFNLWHPLGW